MKRPDEVRREFEKLSIDEHGIIREPNLHDSTLLGLVFSKNTAASANDGKLPDLRILFEAVGGQQYELTLRAVSSVHADGFERHNEVYEVEVQRPPLTHLGHLTWLVEKTTRKADEYLPRLKRIIDEKGLVLVSISSSVGIRLSAISEEVGMVKPSGSRLG
jgi:hypothetical protein